MIEAVRVYQLGAEHTGARWLVDRIWPRGVARTSLDLAGWARDAAPSTELRRWFGHDSRRWGEFRRRYASELDGTPTAWQPLLDSARVADLLLVYAARDADHNNAIALRDYLRQRLLNQPGSAPPGGGDPVCWLHLVCPGCGHLPDDPAVTACPRCGARRHPAP